MKTLIIPDAHAAPNYDNDRFTWLGEFIAEEQPDNIVCLGDFVEFKSISRWKEPLDPDSYDDDIRAARQAMDLLLDPMVRVNKGLRSRRKAQYRPNKVMLLGNHEHRITDYVKEHPEMRGSVTYDDLPFEGWRVVPYQERYYLEDTCFCHNLPSGNMGRPIGGVNIASALLSKGYMSSVVGHAHTFDYAERVRWDGKRLFGLNAGCYVHADFREDWNKAQFDLWWLGVTMLDNHRNGSADIRKVSMDQLRRKYE